MGDYIRKGVSDFKFVATIASAAAPTVAELNAGVDLTEQISDISGMEFENQPVPKPNLASTFTSTVPGEDSASEPVLTFYDDDTTHTIRTALAKGTTGYLVQMPYGQTATKRCEVWPVKVAGVNDLWTVANELAMFKVKFGVTDPPTQNAVVTA